jgi:3-oxoacyl-[acyl-carrier protein] reductase
MFELEGTTALVTGVGAQGGIGFQSAQALLSHGANLVICSTTERVFDREAELESYAKEHFGVSAPKIHAQISDLTDTDQVEYLFKGLDQLDILVNNAGMTSQLKPLRDKESTDLTRLSDESWHSGISRNLDLTFKVTRAALPLLRKSGRGRIITVSSVTGSLMAMKTQPAYAAAKAALVGLMRSVALDEAKYGITANTVLPGWIATDTQDAHEARQGRHTPLGRSGTPQEIAAAILWLSSKEAGYITGQQIIIDGGNSIAEERATD